MALMSLRSRSQVKASMVNESQSFIYTQLYTINSKYYLNKYFNGSDEARILVQLLVCLTPYKVLTIVN